MTSIRMMQHFAQKFDNTSPPRTFQTISQVHTSSTPPPEIGSIQSGQSADPFELPAISHELRHRHHDRICHTLLLR
jgi:hypothetical protein